MVKLPLSIKHLLTLRKPNANPSPSIERLHGVFTSTLREATQHAAQDGWLVLATSTFLSANIPSAVAHLYRYVSRRDPLSGSNVSLLPIADRTAQASLMREAALKSAIFVGVPRTILSLEALHSALETDVKSSLRTVSHREANPENVEIFKDRGRKLWKDIYTPFDVKLADKLGSYHPDFISFIIQSYGSVLGPWYPGDPAYETRNLTRTLTSVVGVACLRTEGGVGPQLLSHVFGLLKARESDSYEGAPSTPGDKWLSSDEGTEWAIKTVDEFCDVGRGVDQEVKARL
ncbi:hypothetical protein M422DRAFT_22717 [Sphaerobolus stellatus SS14]|nr:hypothetical protein M422DRAFT_22717 [Sphaerobolus stellatus SS14]